MFGRFRKKHLGYIIILYILFINACGTEELQGDNIGESNQELAFFNDSEMSNEEALFLIFIAPSISLNKDCNNSKANDKIKSFSCIFNSEDDKSISPDPAPESTAGSISPDPAPESTAGSISPDPAPESTAGSISPDPAPENDTDDVQENGTTISTDSLPENNS